MLLFAGVAILGLSGCNRTCDDCDDCCETPRRRADHSAITYYSECVPAPAPIADPTAKKPVVAAPEVRPVQPAPVVPAPVAPVRVQPAERVVHVSPPAPV